MIFSLQSCVSAGDKSIKKWKRYEWTIVKIDKSDQPAWVIYTRTIGGTNFLEYKIEGNIQSTSKACLGAFKQNLHNHADNTKNKKYPTYEISKESEESLLTYVIHKRALSI